MSITVADDGMGVGGPGMCGGALDMAMAAFQAVLAQVWAPMDQAPKSWVDDAGVVQGVYLLVFEPLDAAFGFGPEDDPATGIGVGWWEPGENGGQGGWYNGSHTIQPTHWMPLPLVPAAARRMQG